MNSEVVPLADLSPEWRAHAVAYLVENDILNRGLNHEALRVLAVSLLICDDDGIVEPALLQLALDDPSILNAADQLIKRAAK